MAVDFDKPLLTLNDVREWQQEKEQIDAQLRVLHIRRRRLDKQLEAAALFIPSAPSPSEQGLFDRIKKGNGHDDGPSLPPLTESVIEFLAQATQPTKRGLIRDAMSKRGYSKKQIGNYFYTVMSRLVDQGRITQNGNTYAVPPDPIEESQSHEASGDVG